MILGKGRRDAFRFTEAIETFGEMLYESDLNKAYERAGLNFTGVFTLFIVLMSLAF